jgi:hypothetical protein
MDGEKKVYIVRDDSDYPQKIVNVFAQKKDANDFALTTNIYIVEEWEVIQ